MNESESLFRRLLNPLIAWWSKARSEFSERKAVDALHDLKESEAGKRAASAIHDLRESDVGKRAASKLGDLRDSDTGKRAAEALNDLRQRDPVRKAEAAARRTLHDLRNGGGSDGTGTS